MSRPNVLDPKDYPADPKLVTCAKAIAYLCERYNCALVGILMSPSGCSGQIVDVQNEWTYLERRPTGEMFADIPPGTEHEQPDGVMEQTMRTLAAIMAHTEEMNAEATKLYTTLAGEYGLSPRCVRTLVQPGMSLDELEDRGRAIADATMPKKQGEKIKAKHTKTQP